MKVELQIAFETVKGSTLIHSMSGCYIRIKKSAYEMFSIYLEHEFTSYNL